MDENKSYRTHPLFRVEQDNHHIITIQPLSAAAPEQLDMIGYLTQFVDLVTFILEREDTVGVVYTCPIQDEKIEYAQLFRQFSSSRSSPSDLFELTSKVLRWETFKKPIVSLFTNNCTAIALATMLWSNYRIASETLQFGFPESRYGLFTAFGATIYLPALIGTENALSLLTQNKLVSSEEAHQLGLINELAQKPDDCLSLAKNWILHPPSIDANQHTKQMDELGPEAILAIQKKARGLYPGTNAVIELLQKKQLSTPFEAAEQEANLYLHVLKRPEPLSMVRTLHYGVQLAKSPKSINHFEDYSLKKIGILGAGMMGSGIAYEAARAGIEVALKDVTISQAQRGKAYAKQVCEKSLALGAMTASQGEQLLARIKPTEQVSDLNGSDCIIEAVFEDFHLKANVTQESLPYLSENGFFATNTTSLPITELAKASTEPKSFIGMHFFSPVDRMPLVEIICGKQTAQKTLEKALATALRLNKIPIVVQDGPGFFTSRIFFNYLLEGITMVLEGISPTLIEEEAIAAGFAVGPLAVLDEISLELMLHVYDQLPQLHASQKRAYNYLKGMVDQGRKGKKSGAGFYDYGTETKKKKIWKNPIIASVKENITATIIRKRLLHVMALDSYRCLAEGVLHQPIDGDIGSILGVGYASHTGGVFGHIDLTTLPLFVSECQLFQPYGEQWDIPASLRELADKDFRFYNGFDSNWS
ncbi:3-hydroxyacyl-CoA dehydrogenase NAD-binding domain-containing protein [Sphingobacterium multivorum]|uniref:Fatty acid oxidation complex subunit alpha n=1 Tax=Sphingobacterium multivorum TaxID=28454 RepID=A0A2X2LXQ7_SPHMU|nr:3-hydroxyacyl-CoA dehydrogenase NAD-binding domain-containing protein [Sphingobacterium multivorum]QRQ62839.1 3-hydroxybutyryl-CoA epimerase [Sphingobacterium multivorum]SPZ94340.1 Fatty acid oxidation complex subunit alpha [Sphingobacterium multivorum]